MIFVHAAPDHALQRIHPMIGGKFEFENIQVFSIMVYQSLMGQLLAQWKRLQPGKPVPKIEIR